MISSWLASSSIVLKRLGNAVLQLGKDKCFPSTLCCVLWLPDRHPGHSPCDSESESSSSGTTTEVLPWPTHVFSQISQAPWSYCTSYWSTLCSGGGRISKRKRSWNLLSSQLLVDFNPELKIWLSCDASAYRIELCCHTRCKMVLSSRWGSSPRFYMAWKRNILKSRRSSCIWLQGTLVKCKLSLMCVWCFHVRTSLLTANRPQTTDDLVHWE